MAALIIFVCLVAGGFTFIILRLSVTCVFWFSKKPNDKPYVFKTHFPYYIIVLFGLCSALIITLDFAYFAIYYAISTYFLALLIWNFKLKHCKRKYTTIKNITKPHHPELP